MITLYEKDTTVFTGNGLCGLSPVSCVVSEEAGGSYELKMQHPLDTEGKYLLLTEERLIKAPVPPVNIPETELPMLQQWKVVNQTPLYSKVPKIQYTKPVYDQMVIIDYDIYVTHAGSWTSSQYCWHSETTYQPDDLVLYNMFYYKALVESTNRQPYGQGTAFWERLEPVFVIHKMVEDVSSSAYIIRQLEVDERIAKLSDASTSSPYGSFSQVRTENFQRGFVLDDDIEVTTEQERHVIPAQTITDQVFRIYSVTCDETSHMCTVQARHISYDFMGNCLYDCKVDEAETHECIAIIQASLINTDTREIATNIEGIKVSQDWSFKNPVNALLDPSTGLVNLVGAKLVRNNRSFFLYENATHPGITISYGVNMIGVKWSRSVDGIYTRIIPRSGSNGGYIYIVDGGQIINGTVTNQNKAYVESAISSNYAYQRDYVLNSKFSVGQGYKKPDGTTGTYTEEQVRANMKTEAANMFLIDKIDTPKFTLDVQFLLLGDTEEYKQYKGLQTVGLYDTVTIKTGKSGITATAQVISYEYDSIMKRHNSIKVGTVNYQKNRTPGYKLMRESITMDKLAPDVINKITGGTQDESD